MSSRTRIKCSGCHKRISRSEPDLVLQKLGSTKQRYYHRRFGAAAMRLIAAGEPGAWHMTNRYVDGGLN